ncbi:relaxase/mobilization nuclease domain-containing protein [Roseomonas frigidaquae]|uniref:Relaxase/mobilization nuclease domain-containing protein n=1 Tax=Falsiroseomonas frigidaquae TaxID=487318 RepID=A0ABX1F8Q4_9PROT|nr:relaxase/mobilization nuclease domain-containing protein [Falsiroseomonas frigidaquae]NKE48770.1 relaxase/mobilization nuclease domain-containing protein [Falsiroseomonas frigidaquae]
MVPALTNGGRSFKGAALYYLHDKRQDGEAERLTSDRVAWTHTVNLPTEDSDRAWRMMATTAMKADELKAAAGVKSTGRKLTKPLTAYSLSWHPSEEPTQAQQIEAAKETLHLLGLAEHQALIVCHNDEPHPHVHVIVNRVHPSEGKAATLSKSKLILSEWALAYEQKHGKIFCPEREANQAKRLEGEYVRDSRIARPTHEFAKAVANDSITTTFTKVEQAQQDAQLAAFGRSMHEAHTKQWEGVKRTYRDAKAKLYGRADERKEQRKDAVKEAYRPQWRELFRQQLAERSAFEGRESSVLGKVWNMAQTARELRRRDIGQVSPMALLWGVVSKTERTNTLGRKQERGRRDLAAKARAAERRQQEHIRQQTKEKADQLRKDFLKECALLREVQAKQQAELKAAWARRNAERKAAFAPLREKIEGWDVLEEIGRRSRQQSQGITRSMQRGRGAGMR